MATVLDIVRGGYRESNLVAISETPSGSQGEEGLVHFNRILASVFGAEVGENLLSVNLGPESAVTILGAEKLIPSNSRLFCNLGAPETIYLPKNPEDGARFSIIDVAQNFATRPLTIDGNGRRIEGLTSKTFNVNGDKYSYLYRADEANWMLVSPLDLPDLFPLAPEFEDFFVTALAIRLNPKYIQSTASETVEAYRKVGRALRARYRQKTEARPEEALLRTPGVRYYFIDFYRN